MRDLLDDDLVSCSCHIETPKYHPTEVMLYTLTKKDMETVTRPYGWLNDNVITASQEIHAQQFPNIKGLQPPTLQQVRGFGVHHDDFVQIIHVTGCHWCVVLTNCCQPGHVNVYDTMYSDVQESTVPIIASLVNCSLPTMKTTCG